jgi:hypothetical protein
MVGKVLNLSAMSSGSYWLRELVRSSVLCAWLEEDDPQASSVFASIVHCQPTTFRLLKAGYATMLKPKTFPSA